jgi:putative tRNA adenosine deaminase-associated protein
MAEDAEGSFAVVVYRDEGHWEAGLLPERLVEDLDGLVAALRQQPGEGGTIGLVNVADEFFVALRVCGEETRLLLSDVTAAVAWDLAKQVAERLEVPVPSGADIDDVRPAGDMSIFVDLGLDEMQLGAELTDLDAYADEMLATIAQRGGFADAYHRALDAAMR